MAFWSWIAKWMIINYLYEFVFDSNGQFVRARFNPCKLFKNKSEQNRCYESNGFDECSAKITIESGSFLTKLGFDPTSETELHAYMTTWISKQQQDTFFWQPT